MASRADRSIEMTMFPKRSISAASPGGTTVVARNDFSFQMHRVFNTPSELKVINEDCLYLNAWTP